MEHFEWDFADHYNFAYDLIRKHEDLDVDSLAVDTIREGRTGSEYIEGFEEFAEGRDEVEIELGDER